MEDKHLLPYKDGIFLEDLTYQYKPIVEYVSNIVGSINRANIKIDDYNHPLYKFTRDFNVNLETINSSLEDLNNKFIRDVETYFSKRYLISFDSFILSERACKLLCIEPLISIDIIIKNINDQFDGDFVSYSEKNAKRHIIDECLVGSNERLMFDKMYGNSDSAWRKSSIFSMSWCDSFNYLLNSLSFFECGRLEPEIFNIKTTHVDSSTKHIPPNNIKKIKAFKLYKNGKTVVYFKSKEIREQFESYMRS